MRKIAPPALGVFLILLGSAAFFWHSRDWNTGSRLMLTYALVDRHTVQITGLEHQTGDLARIHDRYYSDKLPGYPLLATVPYALARSAFRLPPHPLGPPPRPYWPADYWTTLGTSGLLTACIGALLVLLARDLGCTTGASILIGLAYGLCTPAYVYATLAYGHQASAFALLASFLLIRRKVLGYDRLRLTAAGFLAALASVIELQVGPVSAILGLYLVVEVVRRRYPAHMLLTFAAGAMLPTIALLTYNDAAFGSPWDLGYFHHVNFSHVHTRTNPLGLLAPDWSKLGPLLWGRYRGLLVYAPILLLSMPGWVVLWRRRCRALVVVPGLVCASVFLVNLRYPEWTGGWSTGPRLLVPLIPFAMIPVAGLLAGRGRQARILSFIAAMLAIVGGVEMLLFQGAGGRIPNEAWDPELKTKVPLTEPLRDAVWPLWAGEPLPPERRYLDGFALNLAAMAEPAWVEGLDPRWRFLQMMPLVLAQVVAVAILLIAGSRRTTPPDEDPVAVTPGC